MTRSRPVVSVLTPSHNPRYLDAAFASLLAQSFDRWEWVVLLNGGAEWTPPQPDSRVRVEHRAVVAGVGQAKRMAAELSTGEFLVELDHDDLLAPEALERVVAAFHANPEASLVYSDCVGIDGSGRLIDVRYDHGVGWQHRRYSSGNETVWYPVTFEPTAHNVSYIWYAPNHLRAFQRAAYEAVGGHDPSLRVLDDQELMGRLFQHGPFVKVDEVLYFQRLHELNTHRDPVLNAEIQQLTVELYDREIERNALAWANRSGLKALDFGAAHSKPAGYLGVDQYAVDGVDIVATLPDPVPLPDGSVGVIRAVDFFEHVVDKIALINELHRLLAPGGMLISRTPSTDGRGAFQDPTHVAFYNENSFWYYTDDNYLRFTPEVTARFQVSRMRTFYPTAWHEQARISYVEAILIALKPGIPVHGGPLAISGFRPNPSEMHQIESAAH